MSKQTQKTIIRDRQARTGENYTTARRAVLEGTQPPQAPFLEQAACTTDAAVLHALEQRRIVTTLVRERCLDFTRRITGDDHGFYSRPWGSFTPRFTAVGGDAKPAGFGRWKKGPSGQGWAPAVNNPLSAEFDALNDVPSLPIPGLERVTSMLFASRFVSSMVFVLDGTAWFRLGMDPKPYLDQINPDDRIGANWTPVPRQSQVLAVMEDWNARHAGTPHAALSQAETAQAQELLDGMGGASQVEGSEQGTLLE